MRHLRIATFVFPLLMAGAVAHATPSPAMAPDTLLLPEALALPPLPDTLPAASVPLGDRRDYAEVKSDFPMWKGPFGPTWDSISAPYPEEVAWLRQAKFGFWVHFGPQAVGECGDWYARRLYQRDYPAYKAHLKKYGHPSQVGYKDVLRTWNPEHLDPEAYTRLFYEAGARYLFILGVHHDNYDLWNSRYQPWNSVNIGPHRDLLGEWAAAIRAQGMHFGITFHHEYTWWWWQTAFECDSTGPYAGVPYDGRLVYESAEGRWWEPYPLQWLYGINLREYKTMDEFVNRPEEGIFTRHQDYARWYTTQWALRIEDAIEKYDPDFIYTDGNTLQPFCGIRTGTGTKSNAAQRVIASYYNRALKKHGEVDVFSIVKFHPAGRRGIVTTFENTVPKGIKRDQMWIGEAPVGDWFYAEGIDYNAVSVVRYLLECVSRDGNCAVNIPIRPDGSLDSACVDMLHEIGAWMQVNAAGIYGSRAWRVWGESPLTPATMTPRGKLGRRQAEVPFTTGDFRFTLGADSALYAYCMQVPRAGETLVIRSLSREAAQVKAVSLMGSDAPVEWRQTRNALILSCPAEVEQCRITATFRIEVSR